MSSDEWLSARAGLARAALSKTSGPSEPGARLTRTYSLAVAAGLVPLVAIVIVLAVLQFTSQRSALLERLKDEVVMHEVLLSSLIKNVEDYVGSLGTWALINLERAPAGEERALLGEGMIRVVQDPAHPRSPEPSFAAALARSLAPHMHLGHQAMPYVRWTYTLAADGRLVSLFPELRAGAASGGGAETSALEGWLDQPRTSDADDPGRGYWSRPFDDPGGAGWQVVRVQPVERGEQTVGAVAGAVLLDFLTGFLRAFDFEVGRAWLVDTSGDVLASSEGPGVTGLRMRTFDELLPASVGQAAVSDLFRPSTGFDVVGDAYVFTQEVGTTPWRLVFIADADEINGQILPRFIPYAVILAGLVAISVLAHQLRQRLIVRPALAIVEFIRGESQDQAPGKPRVPALWRPWLDAVADAFAAKRASVEQVRTDAERFRQLTESNPLPVCVVDAGTSRLVYGNHVFEDLFALAPAEATGFAAARLFANPTQRAQLQEALEESGAVDRLEVEAKRTDGKAFPVALTARTGALAGTRVIVLGIMDLSEQKRAEAELARQREAMHQSEKLNALGSMLASVAHELNNPLSIVVGYSSMMRDCAGDDDTRERATRLHAAAERCARVVRTFLAMARPKPEARAPTAPRRLLEAALEITAYGLRTSDIEVSVETETALPEVEVDADQITLVLMNLIVNAQHALQAAAPPRRLFLRALAQGEAVRLEVADNGPGIPEEIHSRIFEPFFTTKPQGIGTGIGLSVCKAHVEAHGGTVEMSPRPGGGTTFAILLPGRPSSSAVAGQTAKGTPAVRGSILIVEDEAEVAGLMRDVLAAEGYEIRVAGSGRQALADIATTPVDLIVSDLHMRDLDGRALFEELKARDSDLASRMIFVTGDVLAGDVTGFLGTAGLTLLHKPIDATELRSRIQNALAAGCDHPRHGDRG